MPTTMKQTQEELVANMREWQKIENRGIVSTSQIIEQSRNPLVRLVMEIIQRDSQMHYRVQELIADSLESKAIELNVDEMALLTEMIEKHLALEQRTIELAKESLEKMNGRGMAIQTYLIEYLLKDEEKHNEILQNLAGIRGKMYPYAS